MCGICGELRFDGRAPALGAIDRMLEKLQRRGPDHGGSFSDGPLAFGHRRLAIIDLSPLSRLTQLTELDCENTQVEDLQPIMNLQGLEILRISGTQVKNLKYVSGLRNLRILDMFNTKISNIDVLESFQKLESLKIFNTKISQKKVDGFKARHPKCEVIFY